MPIEHGIIWYSKDGSSNFISSNWIETFWLFGVGQKCRSIIVKLGHYQYELFILDWGGDLLRLGRVGWEWVLDRRWVGPFAIFFISLLLGVRFSPAGESGVLYFFNFLQ